MALNLDPISTPGATRDLFIDLTEALEVDELLTQATVTSAYPSSLAVSNVAINNSAIEWDEKQVAPGKGVHFSITTLLESHATVPLTLVFTGDSGTVDKYEIGQPLVVALSE